MQSTLTEDAHGGVDVRGSWTFVGSAVGLKSGGTFRIAKVVHEFSGTGGPVTGGEIVVDHLIQLGVVDEPYDADDWNVTFMFYTTINASGEVTAQVTLTAGGCQ